MSKLNTTADMIESKTNKVFSDSYPSTGWLDSTYPSAATLNNAYKALFNSAHPIGFIYETSDSDFNPNAAWPDSGVWELVSSECSRKLVSSQVLYPGIEGGGIINKTILCGAYEYDLFLDLFKQFEKPGYHIEFKISAMAYTYENNVMTLYLNNLTLFSVYTWSVPTFRRAAVSDFYRLSDVVPEPAAGYTSNGFNLKYEVTAKPNGSGSNYGFWDVTAHFYLVSDGPVYKWKRIY